MSISIAVIIGGLTVTTAASTVASVVALVQNSKLKSKIHKSLGRVEEMSEDKISRELIEKAVTKAANEKFDSWMEDVKDSILRESRRALEQSAKTAVNSEAERMREKVASTINLQVEDLSIEDLKKRVCKRAEDRVIEQLDINLDNYTRRMEKQMDSFQKSYEKMLKAMDEHRRYNDNIIRFSLT